MDISNLIQFGGDFSPLRADGSKTKMDLNVRKKFDGKEVSSIMASASQKTHTQNLDPKLWTIILGMHSLNFYSISLATTKDGGYAEVLDKESGYYYLAYVKFTEGTTLKQAHYKACGVSPLGVFDEFPSNSNGLALLSAHLAWAIENDSEVRDCIEKLKPMLVVDEDAKDWDNEPFCLTVGKLLCKLTSNVNYTYKNKVEIKPFLERMRQDDLRLIEKEIVCVSYGELEKVCFNVPTNISGKKGMYNLNPSRALTVEEESLVPTLSPSFEFAPWMFTTAEDVLDSSDFEEPFRVLMLYGPSGTGKTQASDGLAYLWNRPKLTWTADPDSDEFKLVGTIMPNTERGGKIDMSLNLDELALMLNLPTFDDIDFDFETSYERLFSKKPNKYSTQLECYKELTNRIMKSNINNKDFVFVKSNIIKALENGWVVEVQEPTVIKRASVLVALNAMLECDLKSATITLPTGETIKRHPEAIVIYTTNRDYAGCIDLQSSVLSRIDCIRRVPNPEDEVLVERTMAKTSCKDKKGLSKMAKVIKSINEYCKEKGIEGGVCGPREFQNWVKKAMIIERRNTGSCSTLSEDSICKAACSTLFEHISQVDEEREDVITAVYNKQYQETLVVAAKRAYEQGLC